MRGTIGARCLRETPLWQQLRKSYLSATRPGSFCPRKPWHALHTKKGDTVYITEGSQGVRLMPYDPDFATQMEAAREIMRENRDVLQRLTE